MAKAAPPSISIIAPAPVVVVDPLLGALVLGSLVLGSLVLGSLVLDALVLGALVLGSLVLVDPPAVVVLGTSVLALVPCTTS